MLTASDPKQGSRKYRYSPGSTLKKKKGQTSDQCGAHHHSIGGLTHAKTQGLCSGSLSLCVSNSRTVSPLGSASEACECWYEKAIRPLYGPCNAAAYRQ